MKRFIMLTILITLSIVFFGCSKEVEIECLDDEILHDDVCQKIYQNTNDYREITVNEEVRKYLLYKPLNLPDDAPLVLLLHGYSDSPYVLREITKFSDLAEEKQFAVAYPLGTKGAGLNHWNASLEYSNVDDYAFLKALAISLQEEFNLSTENTFIGGFSNGGFMSYEVACQNDTTFKAIAVVSGLMSKGTYEACETSGKSLIHIHGSNDPIVPIDGTMTEEFGWGGGPNLEDLISYFIELNGVELYDSGTISEITTFEHYKSDDYYLWYYLIDGYLHIWPGSIDNISPIDIETAGINASEVIWEFFEETMKESE